MDVGERGEGGGGVVGGEGAVEVEEEEEEAGRHAEGLGCLRGGGVEGGGCGALFGSGRLG